MPNSWAAIVGPRSEDRKRITRIVIEGLRGGGRTVGGFMHESFAPGDEIEGYDLVDVETGERRPLARRSPTPEICTWSFDEAGFSGVRARLAASSSDVAVLELGPLEGRGRGHWRAVTELLEGEPRLVLLSFRSEILARVAIELPDPVAGLELPVPPAEVEAFIDELVGRTRSDDGRGRLAGLARSPRES